MFHQSQPLAGFAGWRLVAAAAIITGLVLLNGPSIRRSHEKWSNELVYEQLIRLQNAKMAYMVDKGKMLDDEVTMEDLLRHHEEIKWRIDIDRERYEREQAEYQSGLDIKPAKPIDYRGTISEPPFFAMPGRLEIGKLGELPKFITEDGQEIVADYKAIYGIDPAQLSTQPS